MVNGFEIGDRVRVVLVRPGLGAKVGDTGSVSRIHNLSGDLMIEWDDPRGKCPGYCYVNQFENAGGPW